MPDSDPLLRDRLVAVEVRQQEQEKRVEAIWSESKAYLAELKSMLRENRDQFGEELRDMRINHTSDNERISAQLQSLRESRSLQSGAVGVLQTAASFIGGGGVVALYLAHVLGWK